jgi:hypothetical protein
VLSFALTNARQHDNSDHWIAFPQLIDLNGDGKLDLLTHFDGRPRGSPADDASVVARALNELLETASAWS